MAAKCTLESGPLSPEVPADAGADDGKDAGGGGRRRRKPLDSLVRVRRELASVYWKAKDGALPMDTAKGLTYLLSQIAAVLKAESSTEGELTALLQQVRDKLGKGQA